MKLIMNKSTYLKNNLTIPNILSLFRIFILIPFVFFVLKSNYIVAGLILVISGLTDLFDGYIARKLDQVTRLGEMLDPTADKLTLMTVMICVSIKFPKVFPFMVVLVTKEILMLLAGAVLLKHKKNPPPSKWYGKIATVVFYISVIIIIGMQAFCNLNSDTLNITLMFITSLCMLYSLWRYFKIFVSLMK